MFPEKANLQALLTASNREARIDEIRQFSKATTARRGKETWKDWAFRVSDYLSNRLATLKKEQS